MICQKVIKTTKCHTSENSLFRSHKTTRAQKLDQFRLSAKADNNIRNDAIEARLPADPDRRLFNSDFAPTLIAGRHWGVQDYASFWVTLVISIPTYLLASSLVDLGMSWVQGVGTVLLGNAITLIPMVLNAHPGTKYGIPFPVLARASFGIHGAKLPSLSRAFVACGWFGIQTWIGGSCLHQMISTICPGLTGVVPYLAALGLSADQLACFIAFWVLQVSIVLRGMESIRDLEKYSAPLLVALSLALLAWALTTAGGFGPMLSAPSQFGHGMPKEGQFLAVLLPAVTANVGFWGTLSLNIPDFTRFARSQRDQMLGQALGLPLFMALFTFLGLAVTSATVVIYGHPITDPVQLISKLEGLAPICLSLFGLMWATLTTNIAANVVAPANAFVNMAPQRISFNLGATITALIGLVIMPWKLISSSSGFITWLVGYSALLGPVIGVVMSDYWIVRRTVLDIDSLYTYGTKGQYWYQGGWNIKAILATTAGIIPTLPGFLCTIGLINCVHPTLMAIYDGAWFVGVLISSITYSLMMSPHIHKYPQANLDSGGLSESPAT
ncbi:hypothetical protein CEUSTIGMA_g8003.t1 [Chlamydomonas eustigma]|uniref:Nitrate reductase n=1 Tax=Chlamydomonas eustigma TaxID=1157962 RepID=A0A250XBY5_9CHLO|nr:hypothetical protein CEUSTIGMA_g8003.t1 [Chlamydomonas eustigma]|eukprot:GAX80566.1 hypothetical protein CEUSTIGMA_g8003.t1 [Chlamydomonas eustigma]